jgi:hypothetical protein
MLCCMQPELFRGAVLLAPMLSLEKVSRKGLNPYIRPISSLLSWLWPAGEVVATDHNTLYPEIQAEWDKGEWRWGLWPCEIHEPRGLQDEGCCGALLSALLVSGAWALGGAQLHSQKDGGLGLATREESLLPWLAAALPHAGAGLVS